ncbi:hypothetical protein HMN09_01282300 [Mycena chlorophos]|uniref:Short-chain dehydrogenase/reductase family protein n=1 Tax=Mycena chlorophos TaxID=658473 RepID=A0A8H6VT56_MYCCL|nr:hypothetical protein HMN09_01282300 [Mycena chlorophos]
MPLLQPTIPPLPNTLSFAGKTAIVTGATSGLGFEAALQLAQRDIATLILAVRRVAAGESTKAQILADPLVGKRSSPPHIVVLELNLDRLSSVASFANRVHADFPELHILLLNAGLGGLAFITTPENGYEQMFHANYVANVLLATRLLPLLRATAQRTGAPSHLTLVGSRMSHYASFAKKPVPDSESVFAYMNDKAKFGMGRYGDTKLLAAMWIAEAAKRVPASEVVINNVCPGMVKTALNDKQPLWVRVPVNIVFAIRARTAAVGARTLLSAVTAGEETHGQLLGDMTVEKIVFRGSPQGKRLQEKLWKETSRATEEWTPGAAQEAGF